MTDVKIGIIVGSTPGPSRPGGCRMGTRSGGGRPGARYEISTSQTTRFPRTSKPCPRVTVSISTTTPRHGRPTMARYDGYIFVTPEYNHSTSGVLKNALDHLYAEWHNKAAAFVFLRFPSGGARESSICDCVRRTADGEGPPAAGLLVVHRLRELRPRSPPAALHNDAAVTLFDQLESWSRRVEAAARLMGLRPARIPPGRQRAPGRYRLADKVVSRVGYGAMQLSGDGSLARPGTVTRPLLSCAPRWTPVSITSTPRRPTEPVVSTEPDPRGPSPLPPTGWHW